MRCRRTSPDAAPDAEEDVEVSAAPLASSEEEEPRARPSPLKATNEDLAGATSGTASLSEAEGTPAGCRISGGKQHEHQAPMEARRFTYEGMPWPTCASEEGQR
jgi:hypothetical protein